MIELSAEVTELFPALHKAQGQLRGVVKDSRNPHFKSSYASLESVVETVREPLQAAGLAFTQAPGVIVDGAIEVTTMLMHTSGQWLRSTLHVPLQKRDPQGVGSAITYGCRYALMATLGLPPIDDDGESAVDRTSPRPGPSGHNAHVSSGAASLSQLGETFRQTMMLAKNKDELGGWMSANTEAMKEKLGEEEASRIRQLAAARYRELPEGQPEAAE